MVGYWQNPTATADAIVDGWLRTGDIARIDAAGRVNYGRAKLDLLRRRVLLAH